MTGSIPAAIKSGRGENFYVDLQGFDAKVDIIDPVGFI
jgi:hypothetical protein